MDYKRLNTTNIAALSYVSEKIKEFGNDSEVAGYKAIFLEIERILAPQTSRITIVEELERQIQVQSTIVDILQENINVEPCEQRMIDVRYNYKSAVLAELVHRLKVA